MINYYYSSMINDKNFYKFLNAFQFADLKVFNEIFEVEDIFYTGAGSSFLNIALKEKNSHKIAVESVCYLVDKGIPINLQDLEGNTPLHYAMKSKNVPIVLALLDYGSDPNIPNYENVIPLSMVRNTLDHLEVLKKMLESGGNVHYRISKEVSILQNYKKQAELNPLYIPSYKLMLKYS